MSQLWKSKILVGTVGFFLSVVTLAPSSWIQLHMGNILLSQFVSDNNLQLFQGHCSNLFESVHPPLIVFLFIYFSQPGQA